MRMFFPACQVKALRFVLVSTEEIEVIGTCDVLFEWILMTQIRKESRLTHYPRGYLSDYFDGFAVKRLTAVEIDPATSNQHEFQGVNKLRAILGTSSEKTRFEARITWMDDNDTSMTVHSFVTWSDVRRNKPRNPEYHLYYSAQAAEVVHQASPGDLLLVCRERNDSLLIVITPAGGTVERQLAWLFGFSLEESPGPIVRQIDSGSDRALLYPSTYILDELGIEPFPFEDGKLQQILERFGDSFPTTRAFSEFARETLPGVSAHDNPDEVILAWIEHEERLFRILEKHIVSARLEGGFMGESGPDVDGFIKFSLSVQNRRKSRAGHALENHLETILEARNVRYDRGKTTEGNKKPDFVFPGIQAYHDSGFSQERLSFLGVKSSCKDRWRQVLSEAARIPDKHLLTLEPGISENQTAEMQDAHLQLVIPSAIHESYTSAQQEWLISVTDFIARVLRLQRSA
jgi:hypothetical protein